MRIAHLGKMVGHAEGNCFVCKSRHLDNDIVADDLSVMHDECVYCYRVSRVFAQSVRRRQAAADALVRTIHMRSEPPQRCCRWIRTTNFP